MFRVPITKKISTDFSFFLAYILHISRHFSQAQANTGSRSLRARGESRAPLTCESIPVLPLCDFHSSAKHFMRFFLSFTRVVIEQRRAWGQLFSLGVVTFRCLHGVYKRCKFGDFPLSIGCGMFSILSLRIT